MENHTKKSFWSKHTKSEKNLLLIHFSLAAAGITLAFLGLLKIVNTSNILIPLLGILSILSYFQLRKKNKNISYFQLGVGVFIFLYFIAMNIEQIL